MTKINPFTEEFVKRGVLKTPRIIEAFKKYDKVFEIGFSSGWQTTLLAEIVEAIRESIYLYVKKSSEQFEKKNIPNLFLSHL